MVKINILYKIVDNPSGGGNQFLRNLKKWLLEKGYYTTAEEADVIIFNSHQNIEEVMRLKKAYPNKLFIHRVAGPIKTQTYSNDKRDDIVYISNKYLGDATIFQSQWSMKENIKRGMPRNSVEKIIGNAADPEIFNSKGCEKNNNKRKIRLIATSWSDNMNKGFEVYDYLDQNLDFSRYEMTFVGNSPIKYKNIKMILPLDTVSLAEMLKKQDIYITASKNEACSNALIEALSCKLPAICFDSGSSPEILGKGGLVFKRADEITILLEKIVENYEAYQKNIKCSSLEDVAMSYVELAEQLVQKKQLGQYHPKRSSLFKELKIKVVIKYANLCARKTILQIQMKERRR